MCDFLKLVRSSGPVAQLEMRHVGFPRGFVNKPILNFEGFELDTDRRTLMRAGSHVSLGNRAMELLIALASQPGVMIGARDLMRQIWPDIFVEQSNLRVQIAGLRKALREAGYTDDAIENLPGEGYRFALRVTSDRTG
jgi:DNA-binding winged helix-turn-helix (wHTH) protein